MILPSAPKFNPKFNQSIKESINDTAIEPSTMPNRPEKEPSLPSHPCAYLAITLPALLGELVPVLGLGEQFADGSLGQSQHVLGEDPLPDVIGGENLAHAQRNLRRVQDGGGRGRGRLNHGGRGGGRGGGCGAGDDDADADAASGCMSR